MKYCRDVMFLVEANIYTHVLVIVLQTYFQLSM